MLKEIDDIPTDSDDEDGGRSYLEVGEGDGDGEDTEEEEWKAEAAALRRAISEGAFDKFGSKVKGDIKKVYSEEEAGDATDQVHEVALESDNSDEEDEGGDKPKMGKPSLIELNTVHAKALRVVAAELELAHSALPWVETFATSPDMPLPFGGAMGREGNVLDVHDDLKREVAFYNIALDAVRDARDLCKASQTPFQRPEDFFAEMVKTDDHMAKVKDRLIFETKKMEAFEQRKSNKEQRLRTKEVRSNKALEKSKAKRDHIKAVDDWAKSAAASRIPGAVRDDDAMHLNQLNGGRNKKREAADRKFGHGGKKGRFKQNDRKSLNDTSGFKPGEWKESAKAKRKGKRARDAARSRK